jgi:hypothetical protein
MSDSFLNWWFALLLMGMIPSMFLMASLLEAWHAPIWCGLIAGGIYGAIWVAPALLND